MTLGPPLWATGSWAVNAWADGTWATAVSAGMTSDDLTTLFTAYVADLHDAHLTETDSNTLIRDDYPAVIAGTTERADRNTQYFEYLH